MPHLLRDLSGDHWCKDSPTVSRSSIGMRASMKQSHPSRSIIWDRGWYWEMRGTQLSIVIEPWPCRCCPMYPIRSGSTNTDSRQETTALVVSRNRRTRPGSLHRLSAWKFPWICHSWGKCLRCCYPRVTVCYLIHTIPIPAWQQIHRTFLDNLPLRRELRTTILSQNHGPKRCPCNQVGVWLLILPNPPRELVLPDQWFWCLWLW